MAKPTRTLTIGLILPDILGTYGDDGNALVLRGRARMRGMTADIVPIKLGEPVPDDLSCYTIGGGEDAAQVLAAEHLRTDGGLTRAEYAATAPKPKPKKAVCACPSATGEGDD